MSGKYTKKDLIDQRNLAITRMQALIKELDPAVWEKALKKLSQRDFSKSSKQQVALSFLFEPTFDQPLPAPIPSTTQRAVFAALVADPRVKQTAQAVQANVNRNKDETKKLVLELALETIEKTPGVKLLTPGMSSNKMWVPTARQTGHSAAYCRYRDKYMKLGYQTLILLYKDERPCDSDAILAQRLAEINEIENHLHISLKEKHGKLYQGKMGGAQTGQLNKFFYVYLAVKDK